MTLYTFIHGILFFFFFYTLFHFFFSLCIFYDYYCDFTSSIIIIHAVFYLITEKRWYSIYFSIWKSCLFFLNFSCFIDISYQWYMSTYIILYHVFPHVSVCPFFTLQIHHSPTFFILDWKDKNTTSESVGGSEIQSNQLHLHSVCISVPLHPPPLFFSLSLPTLVFPPFFLSHALFLTVTCVSTCLPLISAFTLQKPSHILKFEESSFQTSRCRQLPHAEHYTYRCESSLYPRLVSA